MVATENCLTLHSLHDSPSLFLHMKLKYIYSSCSIKWRSKLLLEETACTLAPHHQQTVVLKSQTFTNKYPECRQWAALVLNRPQGLFKALTQESCSPDVSMEEEQKPSVTAMFSPWGRFVHFLNIFSLWDKFRFVYTAITFIDNLPSAWNLSAPT